MVVEAVGGAHLRIVTAGSELAGQLTEQVSLKLATRDEIRELALHSVISSCVSMCSLTAGVTAFTVRCASSSYRPTSSVWNGTRA